MPFLGAAAGAIGGFLGSSAGAAVVGGGLSALGGAFNQNAANKGARPVFPEQTGQYLQMLSPLASTGAGTLTEMARTGMPTDVGPAWQAMMDASKRTTKQGYDQLL